MLWSSINDNTPLGGGVKDFVTTVLKSVTRERKGVEKSLMDYPLYVSKTIDQKYLFEIMTGAVGVSK